MVKAQLPTERSTPARPLHYRVEAASLHAHLFRITLTIPKPAALQRLALPVWIPGSYLVREFARHLQKLTARQDGHSASVQQIDKCTWEVRCTAGKPLEVGYEVYANDPSVRAAWLDSTRGFFNGTSLFLRVEGAHDAPHDIQVQPAAGMKGWSLATGLEARKVNKAGFGTYRAANYDELADCPVEMGTFWSGEFKAGGVPHRFIVAGAPPTFDGTQLLEDTRRICETEIAFWHGKEAASARTRPHTPHKTYLFMLNAVDDGYGGLEHRNSTALICNRKDLPRQGLARQGDGYTTLLGLISHEYFHTWNVKQLRPAEFAGYDYGAENYTQLLWFFEGFTSYYDDLLLRRAGLLDDAAYVRLLNKTINQVLQTPGREVQSVAQASFDAWVKYYRQDENTPNATVSYYAKGSLVALCFDLTLREQGKATLDDVMRELYVRCKAGPMREADFAQVLQDLGGRSFNKEIMTWVHGVRELPLKDLLDRNGVSVTEDPSQISQRLGVRVTESQGIVVKTVLRGGAAELAGFCAGDEWIGVEVNGQGWRIHKLDDLALYVLAGKEFTALVSRDKRLVHLAITLPVTVTTWRLGLRDAALTARWLAPAN
ncbi:MAG: M61 family peptidase [Comamonadaceae bacterium]|nr:MAG: M61 family peptidase [Comamonadaceae bacterium]